MQDRDDIVRRVYVHIRQLAETPPDEVDERDVEWYHELLDRLDSAGFPTLEFRFDLHRDMYYPRAGWDGDLNEIYATFRLMRPDVFARQVRALLIYFEVQEKPVIFTDSKHETRN